MIKLPPCIHPQTKQILRKIHCKNYISEFSKGERAIARRRLPMPVSKWAEKHRIIHTSSRPGPWRNDVTRYTQGIMDASFLPSVKTIVLMKSPQTGGTESVHNCIGYSIDRQAGPVLYVYPDEVTARENARDRIVPMIKDSPRLSSLLSPNPDDISNLRIGMMHTTIYMAWSGSPARLGNKPIRYLVLDELDKYQDSGKEARSESLAEKRVTTWGNKARIWKISTPTTVEGPVAVAFRSAEARFDFACVCSYCGKDVVMSFDGLRWSHDKKEVEILSQRLGRYECPHCHKLWTDADRDESVRNGHWVERETKEEIFDFIKKKRPVSIAFWVPATISPFVSLSEICGKLSSYEVTKDEMLLRDIRNNYEGMPWEEDHETRTIEGILTHCDDRPRGIVPSGQRVSVLLAAVDTQLRYFRYVIRAFGYGKSAESWLVQEGVANNFEALERLFFESAYADADGEFYKVKAVIIDAMGEQRRTAAVYEWAAKNRGRVFPSQGVHKMTGGTWKLAPIEYFPSVDGQRTKIQGGIQLFRLDSTYYKSKLASSMAVAIDDPGAFFLHANDNGQLTAYANEMCAETWENKNGGGWENVHKRPNHAWDCEYLVTALADIMHISGIENPLCVVKKPEPEHRRPMLQPVQPQSSFQERIRNMTRRLRGGGR